MAISSRLLGKHSVCPVGLGCMSLSQAYSPAPPDEVGAAILHRALDLGYNHLDTARIYGMGHNEALLGNALKGLRDRFFLASKTGIFADGNRRRIDCRPATIRKACEESLKSLQTDHIDLYYLHRHDYDTPIEESVGTLGDLIREGKIGGAGLSEVSAATLRRAHAEQPIMAVQTEYSLWTRNPELGVLDACKELGTTFVAFSPLGRGVFSNSMRDPSTLAAHDFRAGIPRFAAEHWPTNLDLIDQFNAIAKQQEVTPAQLALAWVLSRGEHIVTIPGTSKMDHMEENIAHWDWQPTAAVLASLDELINQQTVSGHRYGDAMRTNIDTEEYSDMDGVEER